MTPKVILLHSSSSACSAIIRRASSSITWEQILRLKARQHAEWNIFEHDLLVSKYSLYFDKTIRTSKLFYKTAISWTKQLKYALKQNAEAMYTLNVSKFYFWGGVGLNHLTSSGRCFTKGIQESLREGWFRTHKKLFKGQYTQGNKSFLRWNISIVDRTKVIIHREEEPNLSDTLLCQRISCG